MNGDIITKDGDVTDMKGLNAKLDGPSLTNKMKEET